MSPLVLYNPISGHGTAEAFVNSHVVPFLSTNGQTVTSDQIFATQSAAHAGQLIVDFLKSRQPYDDDEITIILCSGDGTLHDIINVLESPAALDHRVGTVAPHLRFVLVPCGTANALFASLFPPKAGIEPSDIAYKLQSLQAYINKQASRATPLVLARTQMPHPSAEKPPETIISLVVVSTSLHASILHDSEELRATMPGIERFKVAAKNNATKWYNSRVKISPAASTPAVQLYDPKVNAFINHPDSTKEDPIVTLDGPFIYFLSTINVDRLEPQFQITPLINAQPPTGASCDVVIIRPLRDPSISHDNHEARELFAAKMWTVLGGAYEEGRHVNFRYNSNGEIGVDGDGPTVVEYIRCGGWEWIPEPSGELDANLLCSDGTISRLERGGRAVCSVVSTTGGAVYSVYA